MLEFVELLKARDFPVPPTNPQRLDWDAGR